MPDKFAYNWVCLDCDHQFDFAGDGESGCCPQCGSSNYEPPPQEITVKSRALAVYMEITSGKQSRPRERGFAFAAENNCVSGKSLWQWEREFNDSPFAVFNQRLRTLGDEQRELIKLSKKGA